MCVVTTKDYPCNQAETAQEDCGCEPHGAHPYGRVPFNININNNANPFIGSYETSPVVNVPPTVIVPQQQQTVVPRRETHVVERDEEPTVVYRSSNRGRKSVIVERDEQPTRSTVSDVERLTSPQEIETTRTTVHADTTPFTKKKLRFKKHYVPSFY